LYALMEMDSQFVWQPAGLSDESIRQFGTSNGTLLVTTETGIYSYDGSTFTPHDLTGLPEVSIRVSLAVNGGIVIGTMESGVFVEAAGWQNLQVPGPASNAIVDIGADSKGTIWTVVKEPFSSSFDGDTWLHHELPFSEGSQWALQVDKDDGVWIATWQNGALRINGDSLVKYGKENSSLQGIENNQYYIVLRDLDIDAFGRIWFPCYLGYPMRPVSFFDPSVEQWDYYTDQDGLEENDIQSIHVVGNDLWTGYVNSGLVMTYLGPDPFDHSDMESRRFTTQDFLPSDNIRVLASTVKTGSGDSRDTTIWIGTNAGLARYEYSYGLIFRTELPVGVGPQVNAIEVDSRNNLWIGTSNGLALFFADGSGFEVFTTANSAIAGNEITSLFLDEDSFLWVGTSSGLSRLDYDFGEVTEVVEDVIAHPNPFIIPDHGKVFFNYDGEADVSILTLAGELVRKTSNSEGWDGRNDSGQLVASGMYFFYVSTPDGASHTGKIAFIRR
jgi:streptogramin lyase